LSSLVIARERVAKNKVQSSKENDVKIALVVVGILLAALGGVMFYRALFLEPSAAVVITNTEVREVPNTMKVIGGAAMFVGGATLAFLAARRRR
jgi:hypothetical protein